MGATREGRFCLITGAKRGIGLEFTRQWLARGDKVFVLARRPEGSPGLAELLRVHAGTLVLQDCDVADDASVGRARRAVESAWSRLDVVVNNAAIFGERGGPIDALDLEAIRRTFEVDALGPIRIARALAPLLRKGSDPKLVQITSLMGSIGDNVSGGYWAYRLGKAALNMATRNLAHDLKADGIVAVALHPGWVRTEMGGPEAPLTAQEAVTSLVRTIDRLTAKRSGAFLDRHGKPCPW